jgi:pimeloyl-ACP methyl ester carboxylesterase
MKEVQVATFVIVHGAFGGGWEWADVRKELRDMGHEVFTPTLTGLGERHHLGPEVGLSTHVEDVVGVLQYEDLRNVVLCGHSYGGMVVTGAADRVPDRVGLVIYADALVPADGQSLVSLVPEFKESILSLTDERGHGAVPVMEELLPPVGVLDDEKRERYVTRLRPHPAGTWTEPLQLSGAIDRVPRAFLRCTATGFDEEGDPIEPGAARARAEGWPYRELDVPHDLQLFDPAGTARLLNELASVRVR